MFGRVVCRYIVGAKGYMELYYIEQIETEDVLVACSTKSTCNSIISLNSSTPMDLLLPFIATRRVGVCGKIAQLYQLLH